MEITSVISVANAYVLDYTYDISFLQPIRAVLGTSDINNSAVNNINLKVKTRKVSRV
jgi:hypothetical protein